MEGERNMVSPVASLQNIYGYGHIGSPIVQTPDSKQWVDLDFVSPKLLKEIRRRYDPSIRNEPSNTLERGAAKIKAWVRQSKVGIDIRLRHRTTEQQDEVTEIRLVSDAHAQRHDIVFPNMSELPAEANEINELPDTSTPLELDSAPIRLLQALSEHAELEEPLPRYEPRREERIYEGQMWSISPDPSSKEELVDSLRGRRTGALSIVPTPTRGLSVGAAEDRRAETLSTSAENNLSRRSRSFNETSTLGQDALQHLTDELHKIKKQLQRERSVSEGLQDIIKMFKEIEQVSNNQAGPSSPQHATRGSFSGLRVTGTRTYRADQNASPVSPISAKPRQYSARRKSLHPRKGIKRSLSSSTVTECVSTQSSMRNSTSKASRKLSYSGANTKSSDEKARDPEAIWSLVLDLQAKILGREHPLVYQAKSDLARSRAKGHCFLDSSSLLESSRLAIDTLGSTHPLALSFSCALDSLKNAIPMNSFSSFDTLRSLLPKLETSPPLSRPWPKAVSLTIIPHTETADSLLSGHVTNSAERDSSRESPICVCGANSADSSLVNISRTAPPQSQQSGVDTGVTASLSTGIVRPPFQPRGAVSAFSRLTLLALSRAFSDAFVWLRQNCGPEPEVARGKVRVRWTCSCGEQLFDDFVERRPGAARELEEYLNSPRGFTRSHGHSSSSSSPSSSQGYQSNNSSPAEPPSSSTSYNSSNSPPGWYSGSGKGQQMSTRVTSLNSSITPLYEPPWLLTCAEESRFTPKLTHLDVSPLTIHSDKDLAIALRQHYTSVNKRWWRPLRLRGLRTIEFVQFEVHQNRFADIRKCPDMPAPGGQYEFEPSDISPPVGSTYLLHLFRHPEDYDGELLTYLRAPKKSGRLNFGVGWGINLVEGFLPDRVWLLSCLFFAIGSLIFAVMWAWKEHSMQNAFGVASWMVAVAVLAVGWLQAYCG